MAITGDAKDLIGSTAVDAGGDKVGKVGQVYLDDESGQPEWVTVNTGLFGTSESFVPLKDATREGDGLRLPYPKDLIKDAPRVGSDGHISEEEECALFEHYGMGADYTAWQSSRGTDGTPSTGQDAEDDFPWMQGKSNAESNSGSDDAEGTAGYDTSGPTTDRAMTRSEEELQVGVEKVRTGTARLRKYVTTENVTTTVPVRKEHVTLEREPITDANRGAAMGGPELSEEEHEVVLSEECPVVTKETVPVERVSLGTETETDQVEVNETVRKENIELADETADQSSGRNH